MKNLRSFRLSMTTLSSHPSPQTTYQNPVFGGYFADPFVFRHDGVYYAVGTGADVPADRRFGMLRSEDFVQWEPIGGALVRPDVVGNDFWAPEIAFHEGKFYLYYSVGVGDKGHQLRVAVSTSPEGPYKDTGSPVLDPATCDFAIDANPFRDDDGRWYLYYARDFLDTENGYRAGTGLVVTPLIDMVHIEPEFNVVMRARHDWQMYQADRAMYGGRYDWHTLEGACMVKHDGRYFCIYSGGNWQNDTYGLDYVVADSPTGPFHDTNPGDRARLLRTVKGKVHGPGHNSVVVGPDNSTQFIAYHAWDPDGTARRLCLDPIDWSSGEPCCHGPSSTPQAV